MPAHDINSAVKERLSNSNEAVKEAVIVGLVKEETDRRVAALTSLVKKVNEFEKELKKLKADNVTYNADRSIASETYSKKVLDEREALQKKIDKHNKAIDAAYGGDFSEAYNLVNDKGGDKPTPEKV